MGDTVEAGESTSGRKTTYLRGKDEDADHLFLGNEFFHVLSGVGPSEPSGDHDAIHGTALNGGAGVTGVGGASRGYGMLGRGGPMKQVGQTPPTTNSPELLPGAGVQARGGDFSVDVGNADSNSSRGGHGPGVIAVAGGVIAPDKQWRPAPEFASNVGVFGLGGNKVTQQTEVTGATIPLGPDFAGAGVVGLGGRSLAADVGEEPSPDRGPGGPGVVGIAGGIGAPDRDEQVGVGVLGWADTAVGVKGRSFGDAGVSGHSVKGTGSIFSSDERAPSQLRPHKNLLITNPNGAVDGNPGDLIVTRFEQQHRLWFCTLPNVWKLVQFV